MNIADLATSLSELESELEYMEMDLLVDEEELKKKEQERKKLLNELLFYDEYEDLYENNNKYELDSKLLYPFKEAYDEQGNLIFLRKSSEEYKEDVQAYLDELTVAFNEGRIDEATFNEMKEEAIELATKQLDRIEKEEKEQENDVDLTSEYNQILDGIETTKEQFINNQIGEDSYKTLSYNYKNMQEIDRKELLYKTHTGLCNELGISFDFDFTKYDIKDDKTVDNEGYCIKTKDVNGIPYPLDTIILEQTYKLYIGQVLQNEKYTPKQRNDLAKMLHESLSKQKGLVLDKIKKRELTPYGC